MADRIPWWEPRMTGREAALLREVLDSGYLNDGEVTARFERALAERLGARHVVAVTSGTTALTLALMAAGVRPGDEVIVPDVTFIATANAVTLAGATPVLADIDPRTLNLDPEAVRRALTSRTRAVIPVHVSGRSADLPAILAIAGERGLAVIEDAAEAFLSRIDGKCLGTFGTAGCFSFSPNKIITTGQGGAVATDDAALAVRLRELKDQGRSVRGTGGDDVHPALGFNFKLTNLQAAVGLAQLEEVEPRLDRMRRTWIRYAAGLRGVTGIALPGFRLDRGESPQWVDAVVDRRDALDRHLAERGVTCRRFWFPLHTQAPYRRPDGEFPNSTCTAPKALWLPSALTLEDGAVDEVCRLVRGFLEGTG